MNIHEIYTTFSAGSRGFVMAVQSHCGFNASDDEIERIAELADTAEEFQSVWENDDSWTDSNNPQDGE